MNDIVKRALMFVFINPNDMLIDVGWRRKKDNLIFLVEEKLVFYQREMI